MDKIQVVVRDNGIGLDDVRYGAFCEVDTDFKSEKGGKGVGRLYWLDAFSKTLIASQYKTAEGLENRTFTFELSNNEQIQPIKSEKSNFPSFGIGSEIRFRAYELRAIESNFRNEEIPSFAILARISFLIL